jgi:hypothetical protein
MSAAPQEVVAVVAQLCNLFCDGDHDVVRRLVDDRGLDPDEAAAELRAAGIERWERPPQEVWTDGDLEADETDDGTWSIWVPVFAGGGRTDSRLRFEAADEFGDGLWEPWIAEVER